MFTKATKQQSKLRCAIFGPSGSGKTMTMLRMGKGILSSIGGKMAVIDSERHSASKYSDRFDFDIHNLETRSIPDYISAIKSAGSEYSVLGIDSASHAWQELLEEVDRIGKAKFKGNKWAAWQEGTPLQKKFLDSILTFPGHVIATMRSKTEWSVEEEGGKKTPRRIGLAPEQRSGVEYEFDLLVELSPDHIANVIKDRTGKFQDKIIEKPGEDFGKELVAWLNEGEPVPPKEAGPNREQLTQALLKNLVEAGKTAEQFIATLVANRKLPPSTGSIEQIPDEMVAKILSNWSYTLKLLQ